MDIIKGSVATAALFLVFMTIPLAGAVTGLLTPAPGIYYSLKSGRVAGLAIVLVVTALLALVADAAALSIYLLEAGVMSVTLPVFLQRRVGGARSIVYSVAVNLVIILAVAAVFGIVTGTDLHAKVIHGVNATIAQTGAMYQKMGVSGDELKKLQESMQQTASVFVDVYPALLTVALGCIGAVNLWAVSRVAARFRVPIHLGDLKRYRNPEPMIWLLIASGFSLLIQDELVHLTALNITIILSALYTVQGLAVVSHYFGRLRIPKVARIIFILLLLFQPFLVLVVTAVGIFDLWGNFRSPRNIKNL